MDWLLNNIGLISGFALSISVVAFYGGKILAVLKETAELLQVTVSAFADSKLTKEEVTSIIKEAKEVVAAIKDITKKDDESD